MADKVDALATTAPATILELVAVCDSRLSQVQALAEKYGNASVWDDPQAMLAANLMWLASAHLTVFITNIP